MLDYYQCNAIAFNVPSRLRSSLGDSPPERNFFDDAFVPGEFRFSDCCNKTFLRQDSVNHFCLFTDCGNS
jgi:hypothetical protein